MTKGGQGWQQQGWWKVIRFCTNLQLVPTDSAGEKKVEYVMIKTIKLGKKLVFGAWERLGSVLG